MTSPELAAALGRLCTDLLAREVGKLPPERVLAERFGVSRNAIRSVLADLDDEGVVRRERGRAGGAFLTGVYPREIVPERVVPKGDARKFVRDLNHAAGLPKMLSEQGFNSGSQVLSADLRVASPIVGTALGLPEGALVVSLVRLRFADGDTLSLEHFYVSAQRFPNFLGHRLDQSMYLMLAEEYGTEISRCEETIEAVTAPAAIADALGVREGDALIRLNRHSWDADGAPVEYSVDLFRADRTRLTVRTDDDRGRVRATAV
ncbi:GntR family transcriptional regulator [Nocardioides sp. GY 10127]|uniref:GntR family transcriptional regulator n=1 Tax=Nocardioides sp. GY 10127 TaxID=2569762 RepID=UPI001458D634|nr:GntR family transcriptional regulator [Nocardioides sp. GY 10127]